ncbi:MAG TPA: glycerol-3-phosphate acyltransferase [Candidatus Limnocylindrales bacterium]|jgi:glycerol-3-phosphate acyltransferase PlsY|nr:glycerol-3-phosphate acyltransferase [Candidatus Limnocylindrales bacterium]
MMWIEQLQSANGAEASIIGLFAYLLGCFTTGYYLVRWRTGEDIRQIGSGSVGARNVSRILGWPGFVLTVLGDAGKGALGIWGARHFTTDDRVVALAMLAVVTGHIWPAQLRLRGGKGMATSLGALFIFDFHLALAFGVLFGIGVALMRKTVLPGLFAFACLPFVAAYLGYDPARPAHDPGKVLAISILTSLVLVAHRRNILEEILHWIERRNLHPKQTPPEP